MTIRGILFDKDGTLFDFQATWGAWSAGLIRGLARDAGHAAALAEALAFDLVTERFRPESAVIAGTPDEATELLHPLLPDWSRAALQRHLIETTLDAPQAEPVPLVPLMDRLRKAGLTLGVATNDAEVPARAQLQGAGIAEAFAFVAGYDSGFGAKPAPGMQAGFLAATGLAAGEVAMVGDSTHDLLAGRAAGMATVAVLTGPAGAETLAPHADAVLPDISHLPAWLGLA
ncbi:MAG: HAD family hydrolase [Pseudomonadota bacterium]